MQTQTDTSVAILIAAYNAEATLARAIGSALAEPEVAEVLVIDDASKDGTLKIATEAARGDARVRVLTQKVNAGPAAARNLGLAHAEAGWVGVLDSDDYFQAGRIARLLAFADSGDFIADALLRTTEEGPVEAVAWHADAGASRQIGFAEFVESNIGGAKRPLDLGFAKPLMRRAFLNDHHLAYRDMRLGEDYELYARALALGARFLLTPAAGYISVERQGSLSKAHSETDLLRLRDCDTALSQIRPLDAAERLAIQRHRHSIDNRLQWRLLINAVKSRDPLAALKTFHSPQAAVYLATRLGEQAWLRSLGRANAR